MPLSQINIYQPEYGKERQERFKATVENYDPRGPYHRTIWQDEVKQLRDALAEVNPNCPFLTNLELSRFPSRGGNDISTPVTPTHHLSKAKLHVRINFYGSR